MMKPLSSAILVLLNCLAVHAAEEMPYRCILNSPEIPADNIRISLPKGKADSLLRAPYAGYVLIDTPTEPGHGLRGFKIVKSAPAGAWDDLALALAKHLQFDAFTTGTHLSTGHVKVYMLFYTVSKPPFAATIPDLQSNKIIINELTPALLSELRKEGSLPMPKTKGSVLKKQGS